MRLNRSKFQAWLKTKRPDEIVGKQRSPSCPIVNFYLDATGGHETIIFERFGEYHMDRGDGGRRLPAWAEQFVAAVDGNETPKITATRALEILAA